MRYNKDDKEILDKLTNLRISQKILKKKKYEIKGNKVTKKMWTTEDLLFLKNNYGTLSKKEIADKLNKTITSVINTANRLGYRDYFIYSEYMTINNLYNLIYKRNLDSYTLSIWLKNGFPYELKIKNKEFEYKCIKLDDFYSWYKNNLDCINLSLSEDGTLPNEPDWFKEKRKADKLAQPFIRQRNWTIEEDKLLEEMSKQKYSYREISLKLKRTGGALKRRIKDLDLKIRPPHAPVHNMWTKEEINIVKDLWLKGYKPCAMMNFINRSDLAIVGILERNKYFNRPPLKYREKGLKK